MLGSNRGVIVAIAGWLIIAAAPGQARQPQTDNASAGHNSQDGFDKIAAAIKDAQEPKQPDPGCEPGKEDRHSDLCAQWKAADPARDSFWLGVAASIIGALTLGSAGFAAWYARKAWIGTEKGVVQATRSAEMAKAALKVSRQTAHRDQRPWLKVEVAVTSVRIEPDEFGMSYSVTCTNIGKTVARDVDIKAMLRLFGEINPIGPIDEAYAEFRGRKLNSGVTVIPTDTGYFSGDVHGLSDNQPWGGKRKDQLTCVVIVSAAYRSEFDNDVHWIEQSFTIGHKGGNFLSERALRRANGCQVADLTVMKYRSGRVN